MTMRLITQRTQVQILPPLPTKPAAVERLQQAYLFGSPFCLVTFTPVKDLQVPVQSDVESLPYPGTAPYLSLTYHGRVRCVSN